VSLFGFRKLGLSERLQRSLATTNSIENTLGTVRRVSRNVKRWKAGMVRRWVAMGLLTAQKRFRRIKGHRDLPQLIAALRSQASAENVGMSRKCAKSGRPLRRRVSRSSFLGDPGASFSSGALAHSTEARFYEKGGRESC